MASLLTVGFGDSPGWQPLRPAADKFDPKTKAALIEPLFINP
jgi:hypothetical protein